MLSKSGCVAGFGKTSHMTSHRSWPVQEAKARFSELLETCVRDGPQIVTKRGEESAVLVPIERWRSMEEQLEPAFVTLKDWLLAPQPKFEMPAPKWRSHLRLRTPPAFED